MTDWLKSENYNKAKCKTCIFRTDGKQVVLSQNRMAEILDYLQNFKSSHVCHQTNLTCYGGLEVTAKAMYEKGIIPEPNVETLLHIASKYI